MKNTALVLCLLLCFPVAGKEKDEVASKKRWTSKSKLACAGALSVLAMALLRSHPKKRDHSYFMKKFSSFSDRKIGKEGEFVHYLTLQTLAPQGDNDTVWSKKFETSIDGYNNKEVRTHFKEARDILYGTSHAFETSICGLGVVKYTKPHIKHCEKSCDEKALKTKELVLGARGVVREERSLGILIIPSKLEKEFLCDVVSQKLDLLEMGGIIKNQPVNPDFKCLALCLKNDSIKCLPGELLQIVKEYTLPTLTLQLPESFLELQKSASIMRLDDEEDFKRFVGGFELCISLVPDSYEIRAVGPNSEDVTAGLT